MARQTIFLVPEPLSSTKDNDRPYPDLFTRHIRALPAFRGLLRAVEARFYQDIDLPEPVLDVGCGDAHFASEAFDRPLRAGLDPWWLPLKEARTRSAYRTLAQADGAHMPFAGGYFASVISNSVLEHIPDIDAVLLDINRVLQAGGRFVFCVPSDNFLPFLSISSGLRRVGLHSLGTMYERWFNFISRHRHCDSPEMWHARLGRAGFEIEHYRYYFSRGALRALEWGHYFGLPAAVAKVLAGRWVLWPSPINLAPTEWLLRRYYEEPPPDKGAYLFFVAHKRIGAA